MKNIQITKLSSRSFAVQNNDGSVNFVTTQSKAIRRFNSFVVSAIRGAAMHHGQTKAGIYTNPN